MPLRPKLLALAAFTLAGLGLHTPSAAAQNKGEPGKFDFYMMNLAWSAEFCSIQDAGPDCPTHWYRPGFLLHGLWAQNFNGTYPVFCSNEPGPASPADNLDVTPNLALLAHEWDKHGTCSAVGPQRFFVLEHQAAHTLRIPIELKHLEHDITLTPGKLLGMFRDINPAFPEGSILLSCNAAHHLTAVEACFSKDLRPIVCQNLPTCQADAITIVPPPKPPAPVHAAPPPAPSPSPAPAPALAPAPAPAPAK